MGPSPPPPRSPLLTDHAHAHEHDHAHDHGHGHAHGHGHGHGHAGGHHHHAPDHFGAAFAIGLTLNIAYVAGEAACGALGQSVALLADAGHNLGDVLALAAAWVARILAGRPPKGRYTYGLRGASILAALGNAVVLLVITGAVAGEAVHRLWSPGAPASRLVIAAALAGVVVNGVTAWLFAAGRHGDINLRGAFLHMLADALVSLGVAVAGAVILFTGWRVLDPIASLAVSAVIVWGSWSLLRQALDMALQAAPPGVEVEAVRTALLARPGVTEVHDLHVWAMSTTEWALTAHLVRPGAPADDAFLRAACDDLNHRFGIGHSTLQVEDGAAHCPLAPAASV